MNEGMPQYRNPFEKGRLIISFNVKFPPSNWLGEDASKLGLLEQLLPPRVEQIIPDAAEECMLTDFAPDTMGGGERGQRRGEAYHEDDDDDEEGGMHGGQRVQCAQH